MRSPQRFDIVWSTAVKERCGTDLLTEPDAIKTLLGWTKSFPEQFQFRHVAAQQGIFHPKLFLFEHRGGRLSAVVGSANLTHGGLVDNHEAGVLIDDQRTCREFAIFIEDCFAQAHLVDAGWLANYRKEWRRRRVIARQMKSSRRRVRSIPVPRPQPNRICGFRFVFTGGIEGWPRTRLYPEIERLGGRFVENPTAVHGADCLVQGRWNSGTDDSQKLQEAKANDLPIVDEAQFLQVLDREYRLRRRKYPS